MKPWALLDTAAVPGGGQLRLLRRDTEFSMRLDQVELMGSRRRGSEQALARLGCASFGLDAVPRILIGGLGMGFTVRAALDVLGPGARLAVAELIPAVIAWARGPLAHLSLYSLDDPRVDMVEGDVGRVIRAANAAYDVILLDVDNGPEGLTRAANDGLYGIPGLKAAWSALATGGVLCVWSAIPDPAFTVRLKRSGFSVEEHRVPAHGDKGPRHTIWRARKLQQLSGE